MASFSGSRTEECAEAQKWIEGEAECKGSLCEHARELATEWVARCPKLTPDGKARVSELLVTFKDRAKEPDSTCAVDLGEVFAGKCGADDTCEAPAQRWASRCGKDVGSPLSVRILERFVARRVKEDRVIALDTSTCAELTQRLTADLACENQFKCEDATQHIATLRDRCLTADSPLPYGVALIQAALFAGAGRPPQPIRGVVDESEKPKFPVETLDGNGVILRVCGERVNDPAGYLAARDACTDGDVQVIRAFRVPGGVEVRTASLTPTKDFVRRYPALAVTGERERAEAALVAALTADIDKAAAIARDTKTAADAARALRGVLDRHGPLLLRSQSAAALVTKHDAAFVAAFRDLGKAKATSKLAKEQVVQVARRGERFAFADMDSDLTFRFAVGAWSAVIDTATLLPQAHAAYIAAMKPLFTRASREKTSDEMDPDLARDLGALADNCDLGRKQSRAAEVKLLECAFGATVCAEADIAKAASDLDSGRDLEGTAYLALAIAEGTSRGKALDLYKQIRTNAKCEIPR